MNYYISKFEIAIITIF